MITWSQVTASRRWPLMGVGALLCLVTLYLFIWSPLIDDIERLRAEIQQQEQESRAALFKIKALQDVDQQLLRIRHELRERFQNIPDEVNPRNFRKDVMDLSRNLHVTLSSWKPDAMVLRDQQTYKNLGIAIKVEGAFFQGISFLRGLEALPWVQSISSVKVVRKSMVNTETTILMDIKIEGMAPSVFEQVKKLLEA
ncbi:MAG: type 4a pilus biogenesis protein PilO [Nitrospirales bacterium]|nr:type II secretion system protein GspM [Nitrospirales bacterium]